MSSATTYLTVCSFNDLKEHSPLVSGFRERAAKMYNEKLQRLEALPHRRCTVITFFVVAILLALAAIYTILDFSGAIGINAFSTPGILGGALALFSSLLLAAIGAYFYFDNHAKKEENEQNRGINVSEAQRVSTEYLMYSLDVIIPPLLERNDLFIVEHNHNYRIYRPREITYLCKEPYISTYISSPDKDCKLSVKDFRECKERIYDPIQGKRKPRSLETLEERQTAWKTSDLAVLRDYKVPNGCSEAACKTYESFLTSSSKRDIRFSYTNVALNLNYFGDLLEIAKLNSDKAFQGFLEDNLCLADVAEENLLEFYKFIERHQLQRVQEAFFYRILKHVNEVSKSLIPPQKLNLTRMVRELIGAKFNSWPAIFPKISFENVTHLVCEDDSHSFNIIKNLPKRLDNLEVITLKAPDLLNTFNSDKVKGLFEWVSETHEEERFDVQIINIQNCPVSNKFLGQLSQIGDFVRAADYLQLIFVKKNTKSQVITDIIEKHKIEADPK